MVGNIVIDLLIGSIPVLGDLFDFAFKANRRNINLLLKHYNSGKSTKTNPVTVVLMIAILVFFWVGFFSVAIWMFNQLASLFPSN